MPNVIAEERYILTDISGNSNSNKFWMFICYDNGSWESKWGRVGVTEQNKLFSGNLYDCQKKAREKMAKGYVKQEIISSSAPATVTAVKHHELSHLAKKQIKTSSIEAQNLIDYLVKANVHNIVNSTNLSYNVDNATFSTPLGVLTQVGVERGKKLIQDISYYVAKQDFRNTELERLANQYFQTVPQNFGMKKPDLSIVLGNQTKLDEQNQILEALEVSLQFVLNGGNNDKIPLKEEVIFDASIHLVTDQNVIDRHDREYNRTKKSMHSSVYDFKLNRVFDLDIAHMTKAYHDSEKTQAIIQRGRKELDLYHGSGTGNLLSILQKGYLIKGLPAGVKIAGKMLGNGAYFSDVSSKSISYSSNVWVSGDKQNKVYMLKNKVAIGIPYLPKHTDEVCHWDKPKSGYDSVFAEGGKVKYSYYDVLKNNEFAVYDTSQILPYALLEFIR